MSTALQPSLHVNWPRLAVCVAVALLLLTGLSLGLRVAGSVAQPGQHAAPLATPHSLF
jgi:hypothetical protein